MTDDDKGKVAALWLTNPVLVWGVVILGAYVGLRWVLPGLYSGTKEAAKAAFGDLEEGVSGAIDAGREFGAEVLGSPTSQDPAQRTTYDTFRGVYTGTDRALSDIVDFFTFQ